jgi:GT2 family glycosyltransferase
MAVSKRHQKSRLQLSIIIVNYNVRDFLYQALRSLDKARSGIRSEVIVVDNASEDGSVEMLRRDFPRVRLIANRSNLGFSRANNLGLKLSRGEFCLLINPDTIVQENVLRVMLDFFQSHPQAGLGGCKILNPDGTFQSACRRSFPTPWVALTKIVGLGTLFPKSRTFGRYNLTYRNIDESYEVDAISGSFMMVRRTVYEQVGGFDEDFFMYGEDLDWCYRIQHAGWKVFYVHTTSIIHYKGESTRRSSLNEVRTFYEAMHLFARKHYGHSYILGWSLKFGIALTAYAALAKSLLKPIRHSLIDFIIVPVSMICAEYIWRGGVFLYPSYAYPIVFVVPAIILVGTLYASGVYTVRSMSISRSLLAVLAGYVVISIFVAFFKTYAFSRMIVVISGALCAILIPGWRVLLRIFGKVDVKGRKSILGRRTLIVGTDASARALLKKLQNVVGGIYEVVGFIDSTMQRVGKTLDDIPVVGSYENISKVVQAQKISDVIFLPQTVRYTDILTMISKTRQHTVNFHLVPSTLEVIIGKGSVDSLNEVPLVEISYNIGRPVHRLTKRLFDIVVSGLLLISVYPILWLKTQARSSSQHVFVSYIPRVFKGTMSLVGPSEAHRASPYGNLFIGKPGMTGMVQLQSRRKPIQDEIDQLNLYYARNQSVLLDIEILIKAWLNFRSANR